MKGRTKRMEKIRYPFGKSQKSQLKAMLRSSVGYGEICLEGFGKKEGYSALLIKPDFTLDPDSGPPDGFSFEDTVLFIFNEKEALVNVQLIKENVS